MEAARVSLAPGVHLLVLLGQGEARDPRSCGGREGVERRQGRRRPSHPCPGPVRLDGLHGHRHRPLHLARQEHRAGLNPQGRFDFIFPVRLISLSIGQNVKFLMVGYARF